MDRQFHILRGASCRDVASFFVVAVCLMNINGKMKRRSGFGIMIAKTRGGMCYRHKLTGLIDGPQASWA